MSDAQEPDPNAPWSPEELTEDLSPEQLLEIQQSLPLLQEVIEWYDEQVAHYGDPETITGVNPSTRPQDVKQAVMFAQTMIKGYKHKRNEFIARFKKHTAIVAPPKE